MAGIDEYRALAEPGRAAAEEAIFPRRRALLGASAERWDDMLRSTAGTKSRAAAYENERETARLDRWRKGIMLGSGARA